jgi:hypothetical protein
VATLVRSVSRHPVLVALVVYAGASVLLFGLPVLADPTHTCLCVGSTTDEGIVAWAFEWWPHALLHGLNPFHPHILFAPGGTDIAQVTMVPGLALVFAPVTALAGPLAAYNVAALLAPALAAWFAFLLCRRLTGAFWPSLVGGWLYGFSTYMLGQEVGHLNLTAVFLVPALVHIAVRVLAEELSLRWSVVLLTIALVGQFSISTEVFLTFTLFAGIALIVGGLVGDAQTRAAIRRLCVPVAIAYAATAVLVSPYLYYALQPGGPPLMPARAEMFSNDLLSFVFPNPLTLVGGTHFLSITGRFTSGGIEGAAYLGVPLLLLAALAVRKGWRRVEIRTLALMLPIVLICSLGAYLHVDGTTSIRLPWDLVHRLPLLGLALPSRFVVYATLVAAVLAATALASGRALPWLLGVISVVSLWPATQFPFWHSVPDVPRLFSTSAYRGVFHPHDVALLLPVGIEGNSMLWQAEARLGFTMAGGYVFAPDPFAGIALGPTLAYNAAVPSAERDARAFIAAHHVTVAVLSAQAVGGSPWPRILARLGWSGVNEDGAVVFRPSPG